MTHVSWAFLGEVARLTDHHRGDGEATICIVNLPNGSKMTIGICNWDDGVSVSRDVRALSIDGDSANIEQLLTSGRIGIYESRDGNWFMELTLPTRHSTSGVISGRKVTQQELSVISEQPVMDFLEPYGVIAVATKQELVSNTGSRKDFLTGVFAAGEANAAVACYVLCRVLPYFREVERNLESRESNWAAVDVNEFSAPSSVSTAPVKSVSAANLHNFDHRPTDEQAAIIDMAGTDKDLVIEALAGTGKTSTLRMFARASGKIKGQYIAFNRAIVNEAATTFPPNVSCKTAHQLAYASVGYRYRNRLSGSRITNADISKFLQCAGYGYKSGSSSLYLRPDQVARYSIATVQAFCRSHLEEFTEEIVPLPIGMNESSEQAEDFISKTLEYAETLWADFASTDGRLSWNNSHDFYLKIWQLSRPRISADFILFDEAQDADPVMLTVINDQNHAQLVYCGDDYQTLYEWRGAKNALSLAPHDEKLWLTQSFRFGPSIAGVANYFLRRLNSPAPILGNPAVESKVEELDKPEAVVCRTNSAVFSALIEAHNSGRQAAVLGGARELVSFARACEELQAGRRTNHPDLAPFETWQEVLTWIEENPEQDPTIARDIRLVVKFTPAGIMKILNRIVDEKQADVVISTVHQSKGREWNSVRLGNDFLHPDDMETEELRVAYVAVTRGKYQLDLAGLFGSDRRKSNQSANRNEAKKGKKRPGIAFSTTRQRF